MTGYALATALAAPVDDGMMLAEAARPARQSPFIEPSTVSCDADETTAIDDSYSSSLTPTTRVGVSASLAGAEM